MRKGCGIVIIGLSLLWASVGWGATYYCSPTGDNANDGSAADDSHAWGTLESVLAAKLGSPVTNSDTLKLTTGYHGQIRLSSKANTDYITIEADTDAVADVNWIYIKNCDYWKFNNLRVSQSFGTYLSPDPEEVSGVPEDTADDYLISLVGSNDRIDITNCEIYSTDDSTGWDAEDWDTLPFHGVLFAATNSTVSGNKIRNVNHGFSCADESLCEPDYITFQDNEIYDLCFDAMHVSGDYGVFQDNYIHDFHDDENVSTHSDCMQGKTGSAFDNVTIRRNLIIATTDPSRTGMDIQGLYIDHMTNGVIENNIVMVTSVNYGISINAQADTVRISNNTVLCPPGYTNVPPIQIDNEEDIINITISNNIAGDYTSYNGGSFIPLVNDVERGIVLVNAQELSQAQFDTHFTNWSNLDVTLKTSSTLVDTASATGAASEDYNEVSRPVGSGYDYGAYETESSTKYLFLFTGS